MSPPPARGLTGMARLRVHNLGVSLDGYSARPDQGPEEPLGTGGEQLHEWMFRTAYWHAMVGEPGGEAGRSTGRAGLVDELHLAVVPLLLGSGELLLGDGVGADLTCAEFVGTPEAAHVRLVRS